MEFSLNAWKVMRFLLNLQRIVVWLQWFRRCFCFYCRMLPSREASIAFTIIPLQHRLIVWTRIWFVFQFFRPCIYLDNFSSIESPTPTHELIVNWGSNAWTTKYGPTPISHCYATIWMGRGMQPLIGFIGRWETSHLRVATQWHAMIWEWWFEYHNTSPKSNHTWVDFKWHCNNNGI